MLQTKPIETPDRTWNQEQLQRVIARAEALLGENLDRLIRKFEAGRSSKTSPKHEHGFVSHLYLLRRAALDPANAVVNAAASVAITQVDGILECFDQWSSDPVWPEFRSALTDPVNYVHAATTLLVASALKEHHPGVKLVAALKERRAADLSVVVTDERDLAVEVKTSPKIGGQVLTISEARVLVEGALDSAGTGTRGQLAHGSPAMLVVGGTDIDSTSFDRLQDACRAVLQANGPGIDHLLGIVVSRLKPDVRVENGRVQTVLQQESRIERNPYYTGALQLKGDWAEDWHLVPRD